MKKRAYTISIDDDYIVEIENDYCIFSFSVSELPHCCGVLEIGNFDLVFGDAFEIDLKDEKLNEAIIKAIKTVYKKENRNGKNKPCRKIIVNLTDNKVCEIFEHCLLQSEIFKEIARFKNINSGNQVRMYLSI